MAIFSMDIKIIGRSHRQSAVASAAYQSGELLLEEESKKKKDFRKKQHQVKFSEILLPENAPKKGKRRAVCPKIYGRITTRAITLGANRLSN